MSIHIPIVHKSQVSTRKTCERMSYYKDVLQLEPEQVNEVSLLGTAGHNTLRLMHHDYVDKLWNTDDTNAVLKYFSFFANNVNELKKYWLSKSVPVIVVQDIKAEDYAEIFASYMNQEYNRRAQMVLMEAPFHFEIKRGKGRYVFEGTLDQLMRIPIDCLTDTLIYDRFYPYAGYEQPYLYVHRDLKFGQKEGSTSQWALTISDEMLIYAYALAFGKFDLNGDGKFEKDLHHIPFVHSLYFLRDLIQYKRASHGKVKGDYKGRAMYPVRFTYDDLKSREGELINIWKALNSGNYLRIASRHSETCERFCGYQMTCATELKESLHESHSNG